MPFWPWFLKPNLSGVWIIPGYEKLYAEGVLYRGCASLLLIPFFVASAYVERMGVLQLDVLRALGFKRVVLARLGSRILRKHIVSEIWSWRLNWWHSERGKDQIGFGLVGGSQVTKESLF